jgi:PAS domain-containing protein
MVHRMIFDESGNAIDYVPIEANPWFSREVGFDPAPILGKRATEYLPEGEALHWVSVFTPTVLEGRTVTISVYSPRKNETYRVAAISPERGIFLTMFSVAGNLRDGGQESNDTQWMNDAQWINGLMATRDFIGKMLMTMPCAAALHRIDCDGEGVPVDYTVVDVNVPFCEYLETTSEAMIGKNASVRLSPDEFRHWLDILAPIALGTKDATVIQVVLPNRLSYEGVAVSLEPGYVLVLFTIESVIHPSSTDL